MGTRCNFVGLPTRPPFSFPPFPNTPGQAKENMTKKGFLIFLCGQLYMATGTRT